ncbi:MAG: SigB/SigF/SigG family RNA polymerase sigma factor [Actinobacteria bacterium]|nr:SigB/SigF/SigG family RNA polymerase sigma factor [Actinomycetota bacterium]
MDIPVTDDLDAPASEGELPPPPPRLQHTVPDRGRARDLFERLCALPDGDAERLRIRAELVELHLPLVEYLARRFRNRGEWLDDLTQVATIGLIKSIDRFDLARGVEFSTYATPTIVGEIKRHFRDKGWAVRVPRGLQELNVQLSRLVEQLTVQLGRSPTIPELASAAGAQEEEVVEALESGRAYSSLSLSSGGGDGEDELDPLESIGTIEHQYEVSEDRAVLAPGFRALDERERKILQLRFFDGLTQSQIAQQVGISQMHVSRLIRRSLEKIRAEIADETEATGSQRRH